MSTPSLQKQVRAAVDLTPRYNDVGGKIPQFKPTSLWYTLLWTTDEDTGDKTNKGRKAKGLDVWFIQLCQW